MLRFVLVVLLSGCGAASSPASATMRAPEPGPPAEMGARVFETVGELGPLAPLVDPALDLSGRVLVLPGLVLPTGAVAVVVREWTSPAGADVLAAVTSTVMGYAARWEWVHADVVEGHLALTYEHDVNGSGLCCSGMVTDEEQCDGLEWLPPVPTEGDVTVWLFAVPREAASGITVRRETTPCVAQ